MDLTQWWQGFAHGYSDLQSKRPPRPPDTDHNRLWALGYMAGYLTAAGIKVGTPNG